MDSIPDSTNVFGLVSTSRSPADVATLFPANVWRIRKCSWTDYEAISEFAELVIEASDPVLIHGPVADPANNVPRVIAPLESAGLSGSFECYTADGALLFTQSFGDITGSG